MFPETDQIIADERGLAFYVSVKQMPENRWRRIEERLPLRVALGVAKERAKPGVEIAVFVDARSGGLLYWTSKDPDVYNSIVLRRGYS